MPGWRPGRGFGFRLGRVRKTKPLNGFEAFQESGDENILDVIDAVVGLLSLLQERVCFVEQYDRRIPPGTAARTTSLSVSRPYPNPLPLPQVGLDYVNAASFHLI
jgi:hypothetical protein